MEPFVYPDETQAELGRYSLKPERVQAIYRVRKP
jgi:hypothetical protein